MPFPPEPPKLRPHQFMTLGPNSASQHPSPHDPSSKHSPSPNTEATEGNTPLARDAWGNCGQKSRTDHSDCGLRTDRVMMFTSTSPAQTLDRAVAGAGASAGTGAPNPSTSAVLAFKAEAAMGHMVMNLTHRFKKEEGKKQGMGNGQDESAPRDASRATSAAQTSMHRDESVPSQQQGSRRSESIASRGLECGHTQLPERKRSVKDNGGEVAAWLRSSRSRAERQTRSRMKEKNSGSLGARDTRSRDSSVKKPQYGIGRNSAPYRNLPADRRQRVDEYARAVDASEAAEKAAELARRELDGFGWKIDATSDKCLTLDFWGEMAAGDMDVAKDVEDDQKQLSRDLIKERNTIRSTYFKAWDLRLKAKKKREDLERKWGKEMVGDFENSRKKD